MFQIMLMISSGGTPKKAQAEVDFVKNTRTQKHWRTMQSFQKRNWLSQKQN
jgi:hypothetical protein